MAKKPNVQAYLTNNGQELCKAIHRWLPPALLTMRYSELELAKKMYVNIGCDLRGIEITDDVIKDLNHLELHHMVRIVREKKDV